VTGDRAARWRPAHPAEEDAPGAKQKEIAVARNTATREADPARRSPANDPGPVRGRRGRAGPETLRPFLILYIVATAVALGFAIWALSDGSSGVEGTLGAWAVTVGVALLLLAGLLRIAVKMPRWLGITFEVLIVLGLAGTIFASWLLMQPWLTVALVAAAVADALRLSARRKPVHADLPS